MDDATASSIILLLLTLSVVGAAIALLIGRLLDPYWRASMLRRITKKDYGVVNILSKDNRRIASLVVNFENDVVNYGGNVWIFEKSHIYRKNKIERGFTISKGEKPNEEPTPIKFEEGLPSVFVDKDTMKPKDFWQEDKPKVPSAEMSGFLLGYTENQIQKSLGWARNNLLFILVIMLLCGANVVIGWTALDTMGRMEKKIDGLQASLATPTGGHVQNGTIVIDQTR